MNLPQPGLQECNDALSMARMGQNDILSVSQIVSFDTHFNKNLKLLELSKDLEKDLTSSKLRIKGETEEEVVICSENRTYSVCFVETSNSLLLVDNMKFSEDVKNVTDRSLNQVKVEGVFYGYLEAALVTPNLSKLKSLLEKCPYEGAHLESDKNEVYSFEELCELVQASDVEIKQALASMDTVTLDGKVRLLDFQYHFRALSFMLKLIDENSWNLDEIDFEETVNSLEELFPKQVIVDLFEKYTEESKMIDSVQFYKYKEDKISQFFAQVLLHDAGKFSLSEFLQAWAESLPEGMVPDEEMLRGIALIDRQSEPNVIWSFDGSELPESLEERFQALFNIKEQWTVPEIAPYISNLTSAKLDVNALLAKHARASVVDGVKYYSSKHCK